LQILAVVAETGKPVSEICRRFEPVPRVQQNVRYKDRSLLENAGVLSAIDLGKTKLGRSGRLVIRRSGTEPVIRVMAEGEDEGLIQSVVSDIVYALSEAAA